MTAKKPVKLQGSCIPKSKISKYIDTEKTFYKSNQGKTGFSFKKKKKKKIVFCVVGIASGQPET